MRQYPQRLTQIHPTPACLLRRRREHPRRQPPPHLHLYLTPRASCISRQITLTQRCGALEIGAGGGYVVETCVGHRGVLSVRYLCVCVCVCVRVCVRVCE